MYFPVKGSRVPWTRGDGAVKEREESSVLEPLTVQSRGW